MNHADLIGALTGIAGADGVLTNAAATP